MARASTVLRGGPDWVASGLVIDRPRFRDRARGASSAAARCAMGRPSGSRTEGCAFRLAPDAGGDGGGTRGHVAARSSNGRRQPACGHDAKASAHREDYRSPRSAVWRRRRTPAAHQRLSRRWLPSAARGRQPGERRTTFVRMPTARRTPRSKYQQLGALRERSLRGRTARVRCTRPRVKPRRAMPGRWHGRPRQGEAETQADREKRARRALAAAYSGTRPREPRAERHGQHAGSRPFNRKSPDRPEALDRPAAWTSRDGANQDEREDVVHHGRAEDDLRVAGARGVRVAKDARAVMPTLVAAMAAPRNR